MKLGTIFNIFGVVLIICGIALILYASHVRNVNANIVASPIADAQSIVENEPLAPTVIQGKPVTLAIDSLGINIPVIDGVLNTDTGVWTLTKDKVQFATMTRQPNNEQGLTFMYGHNRKEVFSKLPKIETGTIATVITDNGHTFTYRFTNSTTVKPYDLSVFSYDGPPVLVLQTCTGLFFEKRELFSFEFVEVTND